MKPLLAILAAALLGACATPQVGPKPNTAPVSSSNAATRQSIKQTRESIKHVREKLKESSEHAAKGATALDRADDLLTKMIDGK